MFYREWAYGEWFEPSVEPYAFYFVTSCD